MNTALTSPHPLSLADKSRFRGRETGACIPGHVTVWEFVHWTSSYIKCLNHATGRYVICPFIRYSNDTGMIHDFDPTIGLSTLWYIIWLLAVFSLSNVLFARLWFSKRAKWFNDLSDWIIRKKMKGNYFNDLLLQLLTLFNRDN